MRYRTIRGNYKRFDKEKIPELLRLYHTNMSLQNIGKHLGYSIHTVIYQIKKAGVVHNRPRSRRKFPCPHCGQLHFPKSA